LQIEMNSSSRQISDPPYPPLAGAAWRTFIDCAFAVIDVLDEELKAACGLSLGWYGVLIHLEDTPEGLRMRDIAERVLHSKSGLTRIVDRMIEEGLVRRERPEHDRRVVLVFLTDKGREVIGPARAAHRDGILRHVVSHMTPDQQQSLLDALEGVRAHLRDERPGRVR
jgi:DNA-binding MarR family transcriptional regulator